MSYLNQLKDRVLSVTESSFDDLCLAIFQFQATQNPVYREYLSHLRISPASVRAVTEIPFLPIEFFKSHEVVSTREPACVVFASSGTTGQITSRHFVADPDFYDAVSEQIFHHFYGPLTDYHILALLPSYLERNNSSLVHMVRYFAEKTRSEHSGFYLHNTDELVERMQVLQRAGDRKILLIGVTFALLDLAEAGPDLSGERLIVMETGGMKGRRREMLREEVHEILTGAFNVPAIHSEYGMTELLSQGYSAGEGLFHLPPGMRVILRDVNDPFTYYTNGSARAGGVNVIDLANVDSCCFLETKDLANSGPDGSFRILGRFDNSDIRGCNLMVL